jgi:signal transduction histidine kinase/CheY-like chemotaxis protein
VAVDTGEREGGNGAAEDRLRRDLAEARDQLAATSQVLTALGRSASDLDAVLDTVVESARRLCRADVAQIHLLKHGIYRLASSSGLSPELAAYILDHPILPDRSTLVGRVGLDRRAQQITDVLADPEYGRLDAQRIQNYRTIMGAPMLLDGDVVGVLYVWRTAVDPFDDRAATVLTTFAAQAAIAIRNVDFVRALEARGGELTRKVEQLEALGEVGEVVSASLDLDQVLATIVTHAVQLSDTDGGSMLEFDDADQEFRVRATYGTDDGLLAQLRQTRIDLTGTLVGRAAVQARPLQVPDLHEAVLDVHLRCLRDAGWRSLVAVPMLRKGSIVGALVVRRKTPGGFSDETCELLQTFAAQSTLAILNARLFRELERKSAELEVASRHKSEFLASMSHELRTPLNAVIGFSEVLLERMFGDLNERQEEYLRDIWSSGKHLLDLLSDILDLSKVEAGRMELDRSTFSVGEALDYGVASMRERALRNAIALDLEVDADIGLIDADERRFKQVLLNLISNAVKFTPHGGRVIVRAVRDRDDLVVTVTDTGIGVPEEDRDRIFESFQQGRRGAHHEGTGLGLNLSKRIVELLGGRMWLDSEVGAGSTFGFTVPVGAPVTAGNRSLVDSAPDAAVVVIVEDDRRSLELLTLYLEGAGVRVVAARDGPTGLDAVRREQPCAVVLDIRLPGMDGWEVLAALKADARTASTPVVVVSILDEPGRGFAVGAAEYLVKPVSREDILAALTRVGVLPEVSRTLLTIDDDPLAVELVKAVLQPEGWTVLSATDGQVGIAMARSQRPSAVLLDLLMPGTDGFAVLEALRTDPVTMSIPIIVLTAKTLTRDDRDRLRGRIWDVAQKDDFKPAVLVDLVRRAAAHARS